jgi:ATP-binding protein involved in chromosome partitioning
MDDKTMTPENECDRKCETCPSAHQCSRPEALARKAKIDVKHVILVLSGKGGVGKSTVSVNLAWALANHGRKVGLLDLDLHGPDIPRMLGLEGSRVVVYAKGMEPIRVTDNLAAMSMAFLIPDPTKPIIWRGPMKMSAIKQFLDQVNWGPLDYLVVDLPPGTGDEALTIAQYAPNVKGAVIVTTPQDVAVMDAVKAANFVGKLGVPVIGVIENMSGMVCPHCGETVDIFSRGGGKNAAGDLGVPYLGAIPLDPAMVKAGDEGKPMIQQHTGSLTGKAVEAVMKNLIKQVEGMENHPETGDRPGARSLSGSR